MQNGRNYAIRSFAVSDDSKKIALLVSNNLLRTSKAIVDPARQTFNVKPRLKIGLAGERQTLNLSLEKATSRVSILDGVPHPLARAKAKKRVVCALLLNSHGFTYSQVRL